MALRYVLDEHLRSAILWQAIQQHNAAGIHTIDATRVGDPPDLPFGTQDRALLLWAEKEDRVVVTRDWSSMLTHLADHLQSGGHSPGVVLVRRRIKVDQLLFELALLAHALDPSELLDQYRYVP
jgi:hypothetical protein